jgi:hypothetical protein
MADEDEILRCAQDDILGSCHPECSARDPERSQG